MAILASPLTNLFASEMVLATKQSHEAAGKLAKILGITHIQARGLISNLGRPEKKALYGLQRWTDGNPIIAKLTAVTKRLIKSQTPTQEVNPGNVIDPTGAVQIFQPAKSAKKRKGRALRAARMAASPSQTAQQIPNTSVEAVIGVLDILRVCYAKAQEAHFAPQQFLQLAKIATE